MTVNIILVWEMLFASKRLLVFTDNKTIVIIRKIKLDQTAERYGNLGWHPLT